MVYFPSPNKCMCYSCLEATSWVISVVPCSQIMKFIRVRTDPEIRNTFPLRPSLPTFQDWKFAPEVTVGFMLNLSTAGREQRRSVCNRDSLALELFGDWDPSDKTVQLLCAKWLWKWWKSLSCYHLTQYLCEDHRTDEIQYPVLHLLQSGLVCGSLPGIPDLVSQEQSVACSRENLLIRSWLASIKLRNRWYDPLGKWR